MTIGGEEVREVGYRAFLLNMAMECNLRGFSAKNVKEGVLVLVDGEKDEVTEFLNRVKRERPKYASVSGIRMETYKGYVPPIEKYSWGLMAEQLSKILQVGVEMVRKQDEGLGVAKENLEVSKETRDLVRENLEVSKETLGVAKETLGVAKENLEVSKETRDLVRENLDTAKGIKEETERLREDLREGLFKEVDKLRAEVMELKKAVARIEKRVGL